MGDTAWELFERLNREEADNYLQTRAKQGFTVIQAVILTELDGLHTPNVYGETPLINDDPAQPNEKYFEHVDYIIDRAEKYHLNIAVLPTWGDKLYKNTWGTGPEIFNDNNAAIFATWLARRYKSRTRFNPLMALELLLAGLSTALPFHSMLYWFGLNMDRYLQWILGLFIVLFWIIMFHLLWVLIPLNLGVGNLFFYFNYYSYRGMVNKDIEL